MISEILSLRVLVVNDDSGRKLPKELGVAEFTVIKYEGGKMQRVCPSKSSVEPVLLRAPLRYSVNILLKSILSPIFHPR
jgi:hypothetical protein